MARPATGSVVEPKGNRKSWGIRFRANGKRQFAALGRPEDGWNREKAEAALRHTLADVERGMWQPPTPEPVVEASEAEPIFYDFAEEWFEARERNWRKSTREDLRWALELHLLPHFKDLHLKEIDAEAIVRYTTAKQREGKLSNNTINRTVGILATILDTALDYGRIDKNPARSKNRRLKGEPRKRPHVEPEQLMSLLEGCTSPKYRILVATLAGAGLRISEAIALRWRNVNLAAGTLRIEDSKTEAGIRVVELSDGPASELRVYKARTKKTAPDDFVFRKENGEPQTIRSAQSRLKAAIRRANKKLAELGIDPIAENISPHSLRRTFISLSLAVGHDVPYVMEQAGHTDPKVTLSVYAKAIRRHQRLTGKHLAEFERALEWQGLGTGMGTEAISVSDDTPANGLLERLDG